MYALMFFGMREVLRNKMLFDVLLSGCSFRSLNKPGLPGVSMLNFNKFKPAFPNERFVKLKFIISRLLPRNKGRINTTGQTHQMQQICGCHCHGQTRTRANINHNKKNVKCNVKTRR